MGDWKKTSHPGVRYRQHPSRKHGVQYDKYFSIRHYVDGTRFEEGVGWSSEGWTAADAYDLRAELQRNKKTGTGPRTLAEKRELEDKSREQEKAAAQARERLDVSFKEYFDETYYPDASTRWKPETARKTVEHVANWIHPVTGSTPMRMIGLEHVQRIRQNMVTDGKSPRMQQYVFRTFAMVWDAAFDHGLVSTPSPTKIKSFRLPKVDNEKQRYLTIDEEQRLLAAVRKRSQTAHDMAVISIDTGLRFSEIAGLSWGCLDLDAKSILVTNTKGKRDRIVPMTGRVGELFESMDAGRPSSLIFPARGGQRQTQIPSSFVRAVDDAKLNDGVTDPKMRASFHSLRHTYASRMVQAGVDLYRVQRLLGHSTPIMTARYGKLADTDLKEAVSRMEAKMKVREEEKTAKVIPLRRVK